ncbi:UDP-N-acetylmuramate:L-alanyl-gamma-D-glutamyl-meso-diaminopimelate ligase [Hahella sp. CCB-MM4]|uniref:UDP-N-acetylmuramate:L-alanyl-gamma-D-glutamyl- meso-diaminopimelate ligase n=1 Tax=Hahella sp. (strain CCB-MM4) TaxID=1926491 RepID=UPI000B9B66EA|nr:UDP-N-acetylmuramate:L-alanyl-gamma-D-glutamyl-meso-diaminopimelate ligase [Hahella sp. CCB-MM4]OZG70786.1 UDP-N-acetylmuramate:L-alanyl-gamma-D-glutamyl-meso-diaminopimelate ligase [Hahella sp. CCB-MM4]
MHIHILGICGTFMGSLALLAKELGYKVTGSDQHVYPPMSTQLMAQGIELREGYEPSHLDPMPDLVIIGNAMSRGNPLVEYVLNKGIRYTSGPQWLSEHVLQERWVLAVAGTHGKTTTTSMLAWILDQCGLAPGFLVGGVPLGFGASARLGDTSFFVIEADEYDSAFFDKRSKFVHYRPRTLIINNLEFDHADIFDDLKAIQTQFHHVVRTVPSQGVIISPKGVNAIEETLARGVWSPRVVYALNDPEADLSAQCLEPDGSRFSVHLKGEIVGTVEWNMTGLHNVQNALAALLAARHIGVKPQNGIQALNEFPGVKRRLEKLGESGGVVAYDDFAHHPTAIRTTLEGLRNRVGKTPIWAIIEPRSNTMKMGVHKDTLLDSAELADHVIWANFEHYDWLDQAVAANAGKHQVLHDVDAIEQVLSSVTGPAHIVLMSNGGFQGLPGRMKKRLEQTTEMS